MPSLPLLSRTAWTRAGTALSASEPMAPSASAAATRTSGFSSLRAAARVGTVARTSAGASLTVPAILARAFAAASRTAGASEFSMAEVRGGRAPAEGGGAGRGGPGLGGGLRGGGGHRGAELAPRGVPKGGRPRGVPPPAHLGGGGAGGGGSDATPPHPQPLSPEGRG